MIYWVRINSDTKITAMFYVYSIVTNYKRFRAIQGFTFHP